MALFLNVEFQNGTYKVALTTTSFDSLEQELKGLLQRVLKCVVDEFEIFDAKDGDITIGDDDELQDFLDSFEDDSASESQLPCIKLVVDEALLKPKIVVPRPCDVQSIDKKIHSAVITWKMPNISNNSNFNAMPDEDLKYNNNNNNNNNVNESDSKYLFEIENCETRMVIATVSKQYVKLSKLDANKHYSFRVRSILIFATNGNNEYSDWSSKVAFSTKKRNVIDFYKNNAPPTPKYLRVVSLYPTSCQLGWRMDQINNKNNGLDFEFFVSEIGGEYNKIVAHSYNTSSTKLSNLQPNTKYKFVIRARYWDPFAKQTTDNGYIMSNYSNCVTIITPSEATNFDNYGAVLESPRENGIEWETFDNGTKLMLFWDAPRKFFGKIRYHLIDENRSNDDGNGRGNGSVLARIDNLPVTLELESGGNEQLFENVGNSNKVYNLSIESFVEIPSEETMNGQAQKITSDNLTKFEIVVNKNNNGEVSCKSNVKVFVRRMSGTKVASDVNTNNNNNNNNNFVFLNKYYCSMDDIYDQIETLYAMKNEDLNNLKNDSRLEMSIENVNGVPTKERISNDKNLNLFCRKYLINTSNASNGRVCLDVYAGFSGAGINNTGNINMASIGNDFMNRNGGFGARSTSVASNNSNNAADLADFTTAWKIG